MSIIIKVPDIGVDQAEVIEVLVKPMEKVDFEQGLIVVEGQKASIEIPCPKIGIVKDIYVKVGDHVKINSSILTLDPIQSDLKKKLKKQSIKLKNKKIDSSNLFVNNIKKKKQNKKSILVHSSPSIKRLCRKLKISIEEVKGTGRKNRILKEDVINYVESIQNNKIKKNKNNFKNNINFKETIFLSKIQNISSKIFSKNWIEIPHVTQFSKLDITKLENFRKKININYKKLGIQFTLLTFIIKAISINLLKFKKFNSILHDKKDRIIIKKDINIGVAVNTIDGVLVPVIKNVNKKTIKKISKELLYLSNKSRNNELQLNDMNQGSFTISNLGNCNVGQFTPIINFPEVAILGISRATIEPVWRNNNFVPRLLLPLSLSYDHRVINGVDGALFIENLDKNLKNFYKLLF
ncbi:2-oxo acid dehydrogenase subunit E2 [Buchnera aphidicola (Periphyllus koelreuteriae)]|uniref:2-oxo acid dehydrogenase subunit E2 n=1 Tax=Buchnera aphidicola TaxID=9 RepID=UPI0031B84361